MSEHTPTPEECDQANRAVCARVVLDKLVRELGGTLPDLPCERELVLQEGDLIRATAEKIVGLLGEVPT